MNTLAQHSFAHAGAHSLQNRQRSPPTISAHYSRAGGSLHSAPQQQGHHIACLLHSHKQQLRAQALGSSQQESGDNANTTSNTTASNSTTRQGRVQLPPPCDLGGIEPQSRWNAVSLAYLGDAVWEAHLRSYLYSHDGIGLTSSTSSQQYNSRVAAKANTHAQSSCYALLMAEGWPSAEEGALMRWAANSSSVAPPKHATRQQYKQATALEALVAYLYLKDSGRLQQLMDWLLEPDRLAQWRTTGGGPQPAPAQPSSQQRPQTVASRQRVRRGSRAGGGTQPP